MNVFEFKDYKQYLSQWLKNHPKNGRGQLRKMSLALRISTTMLSQVLRGDKHINLELGAELAEYLGLNEKESEYFLLLIEHQRAGAYKLQRILLRKIEKEQQQAALLKNRVRSTKELTEEEKVEFYSSWMYSGVRLLTAIPEYGDVEEIAQRLGLDKKTVSRVVNFLIEANLCKRENGRLTYGTQSTHLGADSHLVGKHHQNWRVQALRMMDLKRDKDLYLTAPIALSKDAAEKIRLMLPGFIEQVFAISDPSDSEEVRCLNIDWFEY